VDPCNRQRISQIVETKAGTKFASPNVAAKRAGLHTLDAAHGGATARFPLDWSSLRSVLCSVSVIT
jgi:hypothetical protein